MLASRMEDAKYWTEITTVHCFYQSFSICGIIAVSDVNVRKEKRFISTWDLSYMFGTFLEEDTQPWRPRKFDSREIFCTEVVEIERNTSELVFCFDKTAILLFKVLHLIRLSRGDVKRRWMAAVLCPPWLPIFFKLWPQLVIVTNQVKFGHRWDSLTFFVKAELESP